MGISCAQIMTSLNICGTVLHNLQHLCSHPSPLLPSDHLLPSDLLPSDLLPFELTYPWATSLTDFHKAQPSSKCLTNLGPICGPYHCREKVENVVEERDNRNSKGDKVPLVENC